MESRRDFEKRMREQYPLLYSDLYGSPSRTCMAFGFDIGPGWYPLIEELSPKLEALIRPIHDKEMADPEACCSGCGEKRQWHWFFFLFYSVKYFFLNKWKAIKAFPAWRKRDKAWNKAGQSFWKTLHFAMFRFKYRGACRNWKPSYPRATQMKEKFAGLRLYMTSFTDEIDELISEAEKKSYTICEECGEPGEVKGQGWLVCLCDKCDEIRRSRRK